VDIIRQDGHHVSVQPACSSQPRAAIIAHNDRAGHIRDGSFKSIARCCCLAMDWGGWQLFFVASHLNPGQLASVFIESIENQDTTLTYKSAHAKFATGVDAQDSVGWPEDHENPEICTGAAPRRGWTPILDPPRIIATGWGWTPSAWITIRPSTARGGDPPDWEEIAAAQVGGRPPRRTCIAIALRGAPPRPG
jgi:hypothetical protein